MGVGRPGSSDSMGDLSCEDCIIAPITLEIMADVRKATLCD